MKKHATYLLLLTLFAYSAAGQTSSETALVKGQLINSNQPASDWQIVIPSLKLLSSTDGEGHFSFNNVPFGQQLLVVSPDGSQRDTIQIEVNDKVTDLGAISVNFSGNGIFRPSDQIPSIALEENTVNSNEETTKSQNVSSLLNASSDPFIREAYTFGVYHFQPRGYLHDEQLVLINGIPMNNPETGYASWNQWGGLNDVFRSRNYTYGLNPSEYNFGGLNGSVYLDATAASQYAQKRITYSLSDRQFNNRLMMTYSTGLLQSGWAFSASASGRWANEGYIPGTFYEGYSFFGAVSKKWNKHVLNLTTFGAPTHRGKSSSATHEVYDLAGTHFYNSYWGFQNGEKRNANVANFFQPAFILNYQYDPSEHTKWSTSLAYQFGKDANSSLDWYNASDPRPDYYRNLPSWLTENDQPAQAEQLREKITSDPGQYLQINWNELYNANYLNTETIHDVNGIVGNDVTGHRSLYVLSQDVDNMNKWSFSTNLQHVQGEHLTLYSGINFIYQHTEIYRQLLDLLGGDFFVNYNQFAERDYVGNNNYNQYDLNNPNRIIKEGDKYEYDYINRYYKGWCWGQAAFSYNRIDFFITANAGFNSFSREGLYRNGLFPDNSFGKSPAESFFTYGVKAGATYKLNGRNYLFANALYEEDAPTIDNTYISERTRNSIVDNPKPQKAASIEAGYLLKSPNVNARLTGYSTDIADATIIKRFYNDDPAFQTFVNYVLQDVNMRFIGTEMALDVKLNSSFTVTGVAALGQAFYTNRPLVNVYADNDTALLATSRDVYMQNYYLSVGPQSIYGLRLDYHSKQYWYATINLNYFDRNYVDINPGRRTPEATDLVEAGSEQWNSIVNQEKLPSAFSADILVGKSFLLNKIYDKIPRGVSLNINVGVSNVLNNKDIITGGYEQLRYDFADRNPDQFPNKYFYGYGRNFLINLSLKI